MGQVWDLTLIVFVKETKHLKGSSQINKKEGKCRQEPLKQKKRKGDQRVLAPNMNILMTHKVVFIRRRRTSHQQCLTSINLWSIASIKHEAWRTFASIGIYMYSIIYIRICLIRTTRLLLTKWETNRLIVIARNRSIQYKCLMSLWLFVVGREGVPDFFCRRLLLVFVLFFWCLLV